jgi:hypothetical protein
LNADFQGGTCHLTYAPTTGSLEIRRELPLEQTTDWVNNDAFNVELLEYDLDELTMMMQQLQVNIDHGLARSSWRDLWTPDTQYYVGDNMVDGNTGNIYLCKEEHVSGTTFADDLALGYWALIVDVSTIKNSEQNAVDAAAAALESEQNAATSAQEASDHADRAEQAIDPNRAVVGVDPIVVSGATGDIQVSFDETKANVVRSVTGDAVDNSDPYNPVINLPIQNGIVQTVRAEVPQMVRITTKGVWVMIPEFEVVINPMASNSFFEFQFIADIQVRASENVEAGFQFVYNHSNSIEVGLPPYPHASGLKTVAHMIAQKGQRNYSYINRFRIDGGYDVAQPVTFKMGVFISTSATDLAFNEDPSDANSSNHFTSSSFLAVSEIFATAGIPGEPVEGYEYFLVKRSA